MSPNPDPSDLIAAEIIMFLGARARENRIARQDMKLYDGLGPSGVFAASVQIKEPVGKDRLVNCSFCGEVLTRHRDYYLAIREGLERAVVLENPFASTPERVVARALARKIMSRRCKQQAVEDARIIFRFLSLNASGKELWL